LQYKRGGNGIEMSFSVFPVLSQFDQRLFSHERREPLILEVRFAARSLANFCGKASRGARLRPLTSRHTRRDADNYQFGIEILDDFIQLFPAATFEIDYGDRAGDQMQLIAHGDADPAFARVEADNSTVARRQLRRHLAPRS